MKKMKLLTIFVCLTFMIGALFAPSIVCYADEISDGSGYTEPLEAEQEVSVPEGEEEQGGFTYYYVRISESIATLFEKENLDTLITWCCSVLSVLIVGLLKASVTRLKNKISGTLDGSTAKTNELIEGYNENSARIDELSESTDRLYQMLEEKCALDRSVSEKVSAFADMMFLVYNGSTTLPDGLKDVLRVKYAHLISTADSTDAEGQASK